MPDLVGTGILHDVDVAAAVELFRNVLTETGDFDEAVTSRAPIEQLALMMEAVGEPLVVTVEGEHDLRIRFSNAADEHRLINVLGLVATCVMRGGTVVAIDDDARVWRFAAFNATLYMQRGTAVFDGPLRPQP